MIVGFRKEEVYLYWSGLLFVALTAELRYDYARKLGPGTNVDPNETVSI